MVKERIMASPLILFYAFAVGVSFAATFVILSYVAWGYQHSFWAPHTQEPPEESSKSAKKPPLPLAQGFFSILIRLSYGLGNVANVLLGNTLLSATLVGGVLGAFFVLFSHKLDLPKRLFGIKKHPWCFNVLIPLIFALVFAVILRSLNAKFILL